ncbi:hypothetical protein EV210_11184 [Anaerospora hongkongensis]|uniref:Uncharacterized protein n=1 Tax=Anaerospora hongkongensis TaxID=244830 RepID=A0A4R1PYI2_9FIRM|nr:hypothetical protein [Anaerospora hongkongensis]TCL35620.1 hypothetical protein EV210_11184 [Anaerospora hongkongensis]
MYDSFIALLCDGDSTGRKLFWNAFNLEDLEILAAEKEKAAATNSDQFRTHQ